MRYTYEIVCALEYMHDKCVMHRDMKPENIMIGDDGHLRLIDFGDAKEFDSKNLAEKIETYINPENVDQLENSFDMTSGSIIQARPTFCGTPYYVSPEMLEESLALPASDLWALGCIVFRMHTGKMPFEGPNEMETFNLIVERQIQWPSDLTPETIDLIDKLLVVDPRKRLGTGTEGYASLKKHPYFNTTSTDFIIIK